MGCVTEHHKNNKDAATLKGICVDFEPCKAKVKALLNENERWLNTGGATSCTTMDMIGEHGNGVSASQIAACGSLAAPA